ncbi:cell wall-binding repeat-containing protein [Zafaria sp. Z1313]|uniref:cell wall-binding repeat-containing protein n=1 Tax=unclassified Zafaria TaxID=2828765 RepID=UPI002E78E5C6|nr:cell wall-binding repeat-containing protein [Zafaria sp. J156]MEE1622107.1 cell wall-binding repeat-containing protein [Zafaria sp. J156]
MKKSHRFAAAGAALALAGTAALAGPAIAGPAPTVPGLCWVLSGGGWLGAPCPSTTGDAKPAPAPAPESAPAGPAPEAKAGQSVTGYRIGGATRWETAALISRANYEPGVDNVYLANPNGIDALAASTTLDGPLLLVPPTGALPAPVVAELKRLDPAAVTVLGGPGAVSDAVFAAAVEAARQ